MTKAEQRREVFKKQQEEVNELLNGISMAAERFGAYDENINWGHIGTMSHVLEQLHNIKANLESN